MSRKAGLRGVTGGAAELAAELLRFLDGKPVKARPVATWEHAGKWATRRPVHAALAIVLGASVLAMLAGLAWVRARNNEMLAIVDRSRRIEAGAHEQRFQAHQQRILAYRHRAASQLKLAATLIERNENEAAMSILETLKPSEGVPEARGFAWYLLHRKLDRQVKILATVPNTIRVAAHRRDGRMIALADDANRVFLLDRDTGKLSELPGKSTRYAGP